MPVVGAVRGVSVGRRRLDGANACGLRALGALARPRTRPSGSPRGCGIRSLNFRVVDEHVAEPSSGAMNPKPFSALNHFTVPCGISRDFFLFIPGAVHHFGAPGPFRPPYLRGVLGTRPDLQPSQEPRSQRRSCECEYTNTEAATAVSQSCSGLRRQWEAIDWGTIHIRNVSGGDMRMASDFGRELLACAVDGATPADTTPCVMSPISPRGRGANTRGRSGPIQMWCRRLLIAASPRRGRIRLPQPTSRTPDATSC